MEKCGGNLCHRHCTLFLSIASMPIGGGCLGGEGIGISNRMGYLKRGVARVFNRMEWSDGGVASTFNRMEYLKRGVARVSNRMEWSDEVFANISKRMECLGG